jgi:uncharacterized protein YukE
MANAGTSAPSTLGEIFDALKDGQPATFETAAKAFDDAAASITQAGTDAATAVQPISDGGNGAWQGPAAAAFVTVANRYAQQAQKNGGAVNPYGAALRTAGKALADGKQRIADYLKSVIETQAANGVPYTPDQEQYINGQAQTILDDVIQAYQTCGRQLTPLPGDSGNGGHGGTNGNGTDKNTSPNTSDNTDESSKTTPTPDGNPAPAPAPSDEKQGTPSIGRADAGPPPSIDGEPFIKDIQAPSPIPNAKLVDVNLGNSGVPSVGLAHGGNDPRSLLTSLTPAPSAQIVATPPPAPPAAPPPGPVGPGLPTPGVGMFGPTTGLVAPETSGGLTRLTSGGFLGLDSPGGRESTLTSSGSEVLGRPSAEVTGGPAGTGRTGVPMAPFYGAAGGEGRGERNTWLVGDDDWGGATATGDGTLGRPQPPVQEE